MDPSQYHQEYRAYMEFALQRFLIEQRDFTEYDAKTKVMQDFEEVEREAREAEESQEWEPGRPGLELQFTMSRPSRECTATL